MKRKSPKTMPQADKLAMEFSRLLTEEIGRTKLFIVNERNAKQADPGICHSHDFCDANMVMHEAFLNVSGIHPLKTARGRGCGCGMSRAAVDVWNDAWNLAKRNKFGMIGENDRLPLMGGGITPGEWSFTLSTGNDGLRYRIVSDDKREWGGHGIAAVVNGADAKAIAALPDLLEALERIHRGINWEHTKDRMTDKEMTDCICAALEKAGIEL